MIKIKACLSLSFVIALTSCGKAKTLSANYQDKTVYFTHGSPLALVAGTATNLTGLMPPAEYARYNNFHLMASTSFVEKSRQSTVSSIGEVEDENRTDDSDSTGGVVPIYTFFDAGNNTLLWGATNAPKSPVFTFDNSGALLKLTAINDQPVEVVHYSLKDDLSTFSILVKHTQNSTGIVLTNFVFGSIETINEPEYTTSDYQFLNGSERIPWDENPDVKFCTANASPEMLSTIQTSVSSWGANPNAGSQRTPINYSVLSIFPPFSDLNTHCIYVVESFDESDSPVAKTLGITVPYVNMASRRIVDSDVFLFADLIASELETGDASPVAMHEMGHFWGLGHDFRETASGDALHQTIMGYSKGTDFVTDWDYAAVSDLFYSIPISITVQSSN